MRTQRRSWFVLGVLLALAGGFAAWELARTPSRRAPAWLAPGGADAASDAPRAAQVPAAKLLTQPAVPGAPAPLDEDSKLLETRRRTHAGLRLSNTTQTVAQLTRNDQAVLLRNAFVDTTRPAAFEIPQHLRASARVENYIVQARTRIDDSFRAAIEAAGARVVSYIPNNAFLVRLEDAEAPRLLQHPRVQAVLPFEPYYKLDPNLLPNAIDQRELAAETRLRVTLFPDERERAGAELAQLGLEILGEDRSPFGPQVIVQPNPGALVALARLPGVQAIEPCVPRALLNDTTRVRLNVADDTATKTNYLGLTGRDVLVNINDSGVDASHPDLTGRVTAATPSLLQDPDGHGTHVAATLAGTGTVSTQVSNTPPGSVTDSDFRGVAPEAELFVLPVDLVGGPSLGDAYLQETAARTNPTPAHPLISNNSWGYPGIQAYDSAAASYDAAVRDALPSIAGAQPLVYVFAAGNDGFGDDDGQGGEPGSILSPATAKNVITVGSLESNRRLTNFVLITNIVTDPESSMTFTNYETNLLFFADTDSALQVADFSSRGNVGIGLEGQFGRFKPDLVTPGSFIVSARSEGWEDPEAFNNTDVNTFPGETLGPNSSRLDLILVPEDAIGMVIRVIPVRPVPFPGLPILARYENLPDPNSFTIAGTNRIVLPTNGIPLEPGFYYYRIYNPSSRTVVYDRQTIITRTNFNSEYFDALEHENNKLRPGYRYESGTSMSAPSVSGMLALMQEFFVRAELPRPSSALMKALLINGARSAGPLYSLQVANSVNYQGWGVPNLSNSLPAELEQGNRDGSPLRYVDQDVSLALATGQRRTWNLKLEPETAVLPLRFTLVWTDPPGNPLAATKLVNDLDLVVTNLDSGDVYFGNSFPEGSDFTQAFTTNAPTSADPVNNVENIFIRRPVGTNYSVTVVGTRVNVNALPAHPEGIAQDYALVVSTDAHAVTNAFTFAPGPAALDLPTIAEVLTNGQPVLNRRVGANSPLLGGPNGVPSQWNFYVFTNSFAATNEFTGTNGAGTNVAFITFLPPNLARPRNFDADIDLYVARGSSLVDLAFSPSSVQRSARRGGSEVIYFTNAFDGEVFSIGVKSEDQQGGEYGILVFSSNRPFSEDDDGAVVVNGFPVSVAVEDGTPDQPKAGLVFGIATDSFLIQRAVVDLTVTHENIGDLLGNLEHNGRFVVLNNHFLPSDPNASVSGTFFFSYDDSGAGGVDTAGVTQTDGPGSLNNFVGEESSGAAWQLTMIDNSPAHVGRVDNFSIVLERAPDDLSNISGTVQPNRFVYYFVDVPVDATNLTASLSSLAAPLDLYLRLEERPDLLRFDKLARIVPPGGSLICTPFDIPPLIPGRYFVGVYNPNPFEVNYNLSIVVGRNPDAVAIEVFTVKPALRLPDDAVTTSSMDVRLDRVIADVSVGLRINHPRASDLSVRLVSPEGSRVLLTENRGRATAVNYGAGSDLTGVTYTAFTELTNRTTTLVKYAEPPFATNTVVKTNFLGGFEGVETNVYVAGQTVDGWLITSNEVAVISPPGAYAGTNVLALGAGHIQRLLRTTAGLQYTLSFGYRTVGGGAMTLQLNIDGALAQFFGATTEWQTARHTFVARRSGTLVELLRLVTRTGLQIDHFELIESGANVYYLPEESLSLLKGQRSLGTWQLEVWDNRTGPATGVRPELLSWQLQLILAPETLEAVRLTNGVCHTDTVDRDETKYFIVQVPRAATIATNLLYSIGDVELLLSQLGAPTGNSPPDAAEPADFGGPGEFEVILWSTNGIRYLGPNGAVAKSSPIPQLQPGQRYYLAVRNIDRRERNEFTICVSFDAVDETIIDLESSQPYTNTVPGTTKIDYYRFNVSPTAYLAQFDLIPASGNADLVVTEGLPLPTRLIFDYQSVNPSTNLDQIIVSTASTVPLVPGPWHLGVYNTTTNPVTYTVIASELTNALNIIPLTNTVPLDFTMGPERPITNYFLFSVTNPVPGATFEIYNFSGDSDLLLDRGRIPVAATASYFRKAYASPAAPGSGKIVIRTNDLEPDITGNWYLTVVNPSPAPLDFTIRASTITNADVTIIPLTNGVPFVYTVPGNNDGSPAEIDYYVYDVSTNAAYADFELFPVTGAVDLVVRRGLPLPTESAYHYVSNNGGLTNEVIRVNPVSTPVRLSPGPWYLGVINRRGGLFRNDPATYRVRATEHGPTIVRLSNAQPYFTNTVPREGPHFYQFDVSSNAVGAYFEAQAFNGNLDAYLRYGLPLPGNTSFDYAGQSTSRSLPELLLLTTNSQPVRLQPGSWYLTVVNVDTRQYPYTVTAEEILEEPPGTNRYAPHDAFVSNRFMCVSWPSVPGGKYRIEAKPDSRVRNWASWVPLFTATNFNSLYCVNLQSIGMRFFRVIVLEEPVIPPGTTVYISPEVTYDDRELCLSWPSTPGLAYVVRGRTNIAEGSWDALSPTNVAIATNMTYCLPLPTPYQFFQVVQLGGTTPPEPPPGTNTSVPVIISVNGSQVCFSFTALLGTNYQVLGKTNVNDPTWNAAAPPVTATNTTMTVCLDQPTPYQFFQVVQLGGSSAPPPPAQPIRFDIGGLAFSGSGFTLRWTAEANLRFRVEHAASLPAAWLLLTNIVTSATSNYSFTDDGTQTGGLNGIRYYRVRHEP